MKKQGAREGRKIVVIVGPTASGKSALAIKIARRIGGEIISADSRQVYRGMDIGTGKVTVQEQKLVPHHLLDIASPRRQFTVGEFVRHARAAIADIFARGKTPVIVGGTGLYIDALLANWTLPAVPPNFALRARLERKSAAELFALLEQKDPRRAAAIDHRNPRRLIRALEIIEATGKPVPPLETTLDPNYSIDWIGLNPQNLSDRIEERLDERLRHGMIAEVKKLHAGGISWKRLESFGLEYKWIALFLRKKITEEELRAGLLRDIIRYSKRQMTWFKRNKHIQWLTKSGR
ncbi:MAG TPA: tRNA (adenosine(37)-N6)-dimethylallyltransferase MiaA [Candidatus Paceibacterota bacterium]|nr:tRNA (adenosine(37)-N6)-dimethylallyltransferase MiaA [Candidatus Paceibacterota bacterium]